MTEDLPSRPCYGLQLHLKDTSEEMEMSSSLLRRIWLSCETTSNINVRIFSRSLGKHLRLKSLHIHKVDLYGILANHIYLEGKPKLFACSHIIPSFFLSKEIAIETANYVNKISPQEHTAAFYIQRAEMKTRKSNVECELERQHINKIKNPIICKRKRQNFKVNNLCTKILCHPQSRMVPSTIAASVFTQHNAEHEFNDILTSLDNPYKIPDIQSINIERTPEKHPLTESSVTICIGKDQKQSGNHAIFPEIGYQEFLSKTSSEVNKGEEHDCLQQRPSHIEKPTDPEELKTPDNPEEYCLQGWFV